MRNGFTTSRKQYGFGDVRQRVERERRLFSGLDNRGTRRMRGTRPELYGPQGGDILSNGSVGASVF